jgi:hypothetical protein
LSYGRLSPVSQAHLKAAALALVLLLKSVVQTIHDPREGFPLSRDEISIFVGTLFKRRYAAVERAWTRQSKREREAVVLVVVVTVQE